MEWKATYRKTFKKDSSSVMSAKAWYAELNTHNFLKNVPQKLKDRVDMGVGCELVLAYLKLENSAAVSGAAFMYEQS